MEEKRLAGITGSTGKCGKGDNSIGQGTGNCLLSGKRTESSEYGRVEKIRLHLKLKKMWMESIMNRNGVRIR
ncbi:MAG: hypothetical protein V8R61_03845 [Enterocloster sp.]